MEKLIRESELKSRIRKIIEIEEKREESSWENVTRITWSKNHQIGYIEAFKAMLEDL